MNALDSAVVCIWLAADFDAHDPGLGDHPLGLVALDVLPYDPGLPPDEGPTPPLDALLDAVADGMRSSSKLDLQRAAIGARYWSGEDRYETVLRRVKAYDARKREQAARLQVPPEPKPKPLTDEQRRRMLGGLA